MRGLDVCYSKIYILARCWWLTPVILATLEAEIRRIVVQSQPELLWRQRSGGLFFA
jgi:hypothetical protein